MDIKPTIGVLALQGAFKEHIAMIEEIGYLSMEVRTQKELEEVDALILPGGESTTIGKLLIEFELEKPLKERIKKGLPIWGTCAGMILLARELVGEPSHLKAMDIKVQRNGYGRQLGSFQTRGMFKGIEKEVPMVFIRAPYIVEAGKEVEILSEIDGRIVAAREKNILVTSFHPELTKTTQVLEYFCNEFIK